MSKDTFARIVGGLAAFPSLGRVVLTGFGEPLVHEQCLDMIAELRQLGYAVALGTNGLLLSPDVATSLIELGVDRLVVSLDGVRPETYAGVRGALLGQVLDNVRALNEAKSRLGSLIPSLAIEFVALKGNVTELAELAGLASRLDAARVLVTNVLPYTKEMQEQMLYGYEPRAALAAGGWPVRADAWVTWGTLALPRMHWGAERRCRFVHSQSAVVGWDGTVSPCYALSHTYRYFAIDGKEKQVTRYDLGNVNDRTLAEIWIAEEYVRFRSQVRLFHFPSCPDCDLRETCDLRERNEGCWGWNPSCADCLWAQDLVRCP
jgi:tungsten cofactor oxidoreducase radical SAM maturase